MRRLFLIYDKLKFRMTFVSARRHIHELQDAYAKGIEAGKEWERAKR